MFDPVSALFTIGKWLLTSTAGLTVTALGVGTYLSTQQQKEAKKARKTGEKLAAEQLKFQSELAGQQIALTKTQMQLQMGQQSMKTIADVILKEKEPPPIYRLPSTWEPGLLDRINMQIDSMFRG